MEQTRAAGAKEEEATTHQDWLRKHELQTGAILEPDVETDAFQAEASRQSALVASSPGEAEDQAFVDAAAGDVWSTE